MFDGVTHRCPIHLRMFCSIPIRANRAHTFHRQHQCRRGKTKEKDLGKKRKCFVNQATNPIHRDIFDAWVDMCSFFSTLDWFFSPIYSTGRYINPSSTTTAAPGAHLHPTLTLSDSDNRDPVSSAILKASINQQQRGKSPVTTVASSLPTHSYYTRSKSVGDSAVSPSHSCFSF